VSDVGPTAGSLIELADTGLVIRVEADAQRAGDEFRTGFARTARDGIHLRAATAAQTCDIVVSNVTLVDPVLGIRNVSIGVRAGRVSSIFDRAGREP
jgi:urease subunit alpha